MTRGHLVVHRRVDPKWSHQLREHNIAERAFGAFGHHASGGDHRVFWADPARNLAFATVGAAALLRPSDATVGSDRFAEVADRRAALAETLQVIGDDNAPIRLVGGFAFEPSTDGQSIWHGFDSGWLVLPALAVVDDGVGVSLLAAAAIDTDVSTIDELSARLDGRLDQLLKQLRMVSSTAPALADSNRSNRMVRHHDQGPGDHSAWSEDESYVKLVRRGIDDIEAGLLDKVVLAREAVVPGSVDLEPLISALRDRHTACTTFAFAIGDRAFVGSTPERLVSFGVDGLHTAAVAGTIRRGADPADDRRLGAELLASAKDRGEHDFVVRAVRDRLDALGVRSAAPSEPVVMTLASLQHLHTPITGHVDPGSDIDVVRIAGALHPTPAVAGTPTDAACEWIADQEPFERGWYAAPIGWCDLDGHGEFNVGLRSALVTPDEVRLFAGAGIVSDSDPDLELIETTVKLDAFGGALAAAVAGFDPAAGR